MNVFGHSLFCGLFGVVLKFWKPMDFITKIPDVIGIKNWIEHNTHRFQRSFSNVIRAL